MTKHIISIEPEDALMLFGALVHEQCAALKRHVTIGFAVRDWGTWVLDTKANDIICSGWREGLDLQILCNREALSDFVFGQLDLESPNPDHLFICSGERSAMIALRDMFKGVRSWLEIRVAQCKKD